MANPQAKATSSVKSGKESNQYAATVLGGVPDKKSVEEIEKVNRPKSAPGSVRS